MAEVLWNLLVLLLFCLEFLEAWKCFADSWSSLVVLALGELVLSSFLEAVFLEGLWKSFTEKDFANRTGLAQAWTVKSADRLPTLELQIHCAEMMELKAPCTRGSELISSLRFWLFDFKSFWLPRVANKTDQRRENIYSSGDPF